VVIAPDTEAWSSAKSVRPGLRKTLTNISVSRIAKQPLLQGVFMTVEEARQQHLELMMKTLVESWEDTKRAYSRESFEGLSKPFKGVEDDDLPQWKRWD